MSYFQHHLNGWCLRLAAQEALLRAKKLQKLYPELVLSTTAALLRVLASEDDHVRGHSHQAWPGNQDAARQLFEVYGQDDTIAKLIQGREGRIQGAADRLYQEIQKVAPGKVPLKISGGKVALGRSTDEIRNDLLAHYLSHDNLAKLAYDCWIDEGRPDGEQFEIRYGMKTKDRHWLRATLLAEIFADIDAITIAMLQSRSSARFMAGLEDKQTVLVTPTPALPNVVIDLEIPK